MKIMGQVFLLKTGNGTFVLMRYLLSITLWMAFQWNASAQFVTGSYGGSRQVVDAAIDFQGQETDTNMAFTFYSIPHFSRTNTMGAITGYVITQTDSLEGMETSYFEALGKRVAIRTKLTENKKHVRSSQEFTFERGSFHDVMGDTVIAGWTCKRAKWISMDQSESNFSGWYAQELPYHLANRYNGLSGMPMKFYFNQDQITCLYERSYASREWPIRTLFELIPEHELIESPNQN
jgi:hypothetical protein